MNEQTAHNPFKSGLWLCWTAMFILPIGLLAIGGGQCAGPRNALGSTILLGVGCGAACAAIVGAVRVLRSIRARAVAGKLWGVCSILCAGLAAFVGGFYVLLGCVSLQAFLQY